MFWFCGKCGNEFEGGNVKETQCTDCDEMLKRGYPGDYRAWCD